LRKPFDRLISNLRHYLGPFEGNATSRSGTSVAAK
jgi:hypothetical protein